MMHPCTAAAYIEMIQETNRARAICAAETAIAVSERSSDSRVNTGNWVQLQTYTVSHLRGDNNSSTWMRPHPLTLYSMVVMPCGRSLCVCDAQYR